MNGVSTMRWPSSRARGDFNGGELPRYNGWLHFRRTRQTLSPNLSSDCVDFDGIVMQ